MTVIRRKQPKKAPPLPPNARLEESLTVCPRCGGRGELSDTALDCSECDGTGVKATSSRIIQACEEPFLKATD